MTRTVAVLLMVTLALALTGCLSEDEGPLQIEVKNYRLLDPANLTFVLVVRNVGDEPVTAVKIRPSGSIGWEKREPLGYSKGNITGYPMPDIPRRFYNLSDVLEPGHEREFPLKVHFGRDGFGNDPPLEEAIYYKVRVGFRYQESNRAWDNYYQGPCIDKNGELMERSCESTSFLWTHLED